MAATTTSVQDVYERLCRKFVDIVSQEELKEGERLFFEHAGDEDCQHDHHVDDAGDHGHSESKSECGHGAHGEEQHHHHSSGDDCNPEEEDKNMKLGFYRAYWCKNLFLLQAGLVKEAFKVAVENQVVNKSFFKDVKIVAGFGCGPASDLIGFLEFFKELPEETRSSSHPTLIGIDAEEGWRDYVIEAGCLFECSKVDSIYLKEMPKYDVIVMCCFACHTGLANEKTNLDLLAGKCKLLMILDFDDPVLDTAMKERHFFCHTLKGKTDLFPGYELNVYAKQFD